MKAFATVLFCSLILWCFPAAAKPDGRAIASYTVSPKYGPELPEGRGWFKLTLDGRGRVLSVAVLKGTGHRVLDDSAIVALKQWRFRPVPENYVTMPVAFMHGGHKASMTLRYR